MGDKPDRATNYYAFCHDFLVLYKKICLKEGEVWRKVVTNKIIVHLSQKVCCLLSCPVLLHKFFNMRTEGAIESVQIRALSWLN